MHSNTNEIIEILSDDEDENEARLSCSLRWLITKAYQHQTIPDYLPHEHFFQNENHERFLSPDIALVLLSGDLYIRAFQNITNRQDEIITYENVLEYFLRTQNQQIDMNLLKQDDPLNAHVHLELIDYLMNLYFQFHFDQNRLYQRMNKLQLKSILKLFNQSQQLNIESQLIIWLNGICEYVSNLNSQRIPPVIDLRSAIIDGQCLFALVSYYDHEYNQQINRTNLNTLRYYLNHYRGHSMTNIFPFTIRNLRENLIPDINLQAMLVDLFVLFEKTHANENDNDDDDDDDDENICLNKSNQTYSINGDEQEDELDFSINQSTTGDIFQINTNHQRQISMPIKSSLKTSISTLPKKTSFLSTTTTWQRQAQTNQSIPINTTCKNNQDDLQLTNEYHAIKMQLEMKKRSIERDKQRLEIQRDNKRQIISQEAFKQLLQQKTKNNDLHLNSSHIRKSQTTSEFRSQTISTNNQTINSNEIKSDHTSIVDLSKPMTRDDFLNTLELLKQKYIETTTTTPTIVEECRTDEQQRIEQLNSNIGELQQVINNLSDKQEEIHNQIIEANGNTNLSRNATFSRKSLTFARRPSTSTPRETTEQMPNTNGIVIDLIDDTSTSTTLEIERKRELILLKQQQRQQTFDQRRQLREIENSKRDYQRQQKDLEETNKKHEREQRREEIYRQYIAKKEKKFSNTNETNQQIDEHPTIKIRPKTSTQRRQTGPIVISTFGTPIDSTANTDHIFNNTDLNETITTPSLSFVRMAELRSNKTSNKIDSRTLPRSSARTTIESTLPIIPVSEPRYPLAKPLSGKSNRQTIHNALTQVILAGKVNDRIREQVCDEIERHTDKIKHFIILFRDSRLQFRGIYAFLPLTNATTDTIQRIERIYGQGPKEIAETMVDTFYKYNNGSKQFSHVPMKSFSVQCDAVTISNQYWTQQMAASKRTTPNLPVSPSD